MLVEVVESTTDPWTVAAFWSGLLFGLASVAVGIAAVVLARKANQAAIKAAEEAERANVEASRARAAVAAERRRTFQLEILRDLMAELDDGRAPSDRQAPRWGEADLSFIIETPSIVTNRYAGRLPLLDEDDLPFWRLMGTIRPVALPAALGLPDNETAPESRQDVRRALKSRIRQDLIKAIERRMEARDA
jgi:hypothetical protein